MYNRYIPQPDGSYRKNRVADTIPPPPQNTPPPTHSEPIPMPLPKLTEPRRPYRQSPGRPMPPKPHHPQENTSVGNFLKQLLPKNFDSEDLLIVLLLLLMSGDCREDQNTALLTLALYLFM